MNLIQYRIRWSDHSINRSIDYQ